MQGTPKFATPSLLAEALSGCASMDRVSTKSDALNTYCPFVEPFLTSAMDEVLQPLIFTSQDTSFYEHGLNVIFWLTGVAPLHPIAYFASVPFD